MPTVAVGIYRIHVRAVPNDFMGPGSRGFKKEIKIKCEAQSSRKTSPCRVVQNVLPTKAINSRSLREESSLSTENVVPRVEQNIAPQIGDGQVSVLGLHNGIQVLNSVEELKFYRLFKRNKAKRTSLTRML